MSSNDMSSQSITTRPKILMSSSKTYEEFVYDSAFSFVCLVLLTTEELPDVL